MSNTINECEWFEQIVGFSEKKWNYKLDTLPTIITENMGTFKTPSIQEMQPIINSKPNTGIKKLKFIFRKQKTRDNESLFDTSELQFNSIPNALFQVASNFNCHELGSPSRSVFSGRYITQLMVDHTQGPSASGGAVFGAFGRVAQHKEKEINLLEDTTLNPTNGKLYNTAKFSFFNPDLIKVGIQTGVRATFSRSYHNFKYNPQGVKINQVYTSTSIFSNSYDNNHELADILLEKAYEGTYLAGIELCCPKLVLTLIGGGVFHNPMNLIIRNILDNHEKYSPYLPAGCVVEIPIYETNRTDIENLLKKSVFPIDIAWI
jgi:hypothetical protein